MLETPEIKVIINRGVKLNILVTSLPDLNKINPQRPHHLLKYLAKKHNITVLCVNAWWLDGLQDKFLEESLKNIEIHYLSRKRIGPISQELLAVRGLKNLIQDLDPNSIDIYLNLNSLFAGYYIGRTIKAPMVFDICDDIVDWIGNSRRIPSLLRPLAKIVGYSMLKRNIDLSRKITYSAPFLKKFYSISDTKSSLIPNGVDTNLFLRSDHNIREKLNLSEDTFVLGFVGFLGEWVNFSYLFEAIKDLKQDLNIKLIIVGTGTLI